ncbi:Hypothetical protein PEIBARAKI_5338 [Petrimonas sp. IBARAKI]|nr:Hypothetical protein PEIBARAKI_5338 [Petrimonas sp. IBARAKI]
MKTKVNKSDVFKRAWRMFKDVTRPAFLNAYGSYYSLKDFSGCLAAAWGLEKGIAAFKEQERIEAEKKAEQERIRQTWKRVNFTPNYESMNAFYSRSGAYHGG